MVGGALPYQSEEVGGDVQAVGAAEVRGVRRRCDNYRETSLFASKANGSELARIRSVESG
jgi:hypothetical protein